MSEMKQAGTSGPKPILHTLASKGSGTGIGYYTAFAAGCPLSAALYNSDDRTFMDEKSGAAIGTIGHAFQELHWKRQLDPNAQPSVAVEFTQHIAEENLVEAERLFRYFRSIIPEPDGLGTVVDVEATFPVPEDDAQAAVLHWLFEVPFTMRVDLITDLTEQHITRLKKKAVGWDGHLGILRPGRWLWDYKHYSRRESNLLDKTLGSIQYAAYIESYNALVEEQALAGPPVNGLIQCAIFTTKQPDIRMTVVPPPSAELFEAVERLVSLGAERAKTPDLTVPSDNNCFSYGKICRWLTEGLCNRAGATEAGLVQLRKGGFVK